MKHDTYCEKTDHLGSVDENRIHDPYIWSTSEQARHRALSLYLIRSIVERRGGTIDVDLATDTININVPKDEELACAQEIEEKVGKMCR